MNIFTSWKQSVAILYPKNLKNLILVTINALVSAYRELLLAGVLVSLLLAMSWPRLWAELITNFSPLVYGVSTDVLFDMLQPDRGAYFLGIDLAALRQLLVWLIYDMVLILAMSMVAIVLRPSVFLKNVAYHSAYCDAFSLKLMKLTFAVHVAWLALSAACSYALDLLRLHLSYITYGAYFLLMPPAFLVDKVTPGWTFAVATLHVPFGMLVNYWPLYILIYFFMLDNCSMYRSVRNALVMVVYNYPILLVIRTLFAAISYALSYGLNYVQPQSQDVYLIFASCIIGFIMMPLGYALMSVIYTKRVHDTPELFMS